MHARGGPDSSARAKPSASPPRRGEIRTLRWNEDHLALDFQGRVRGMSTGRGGSRRSLMPSPMDWLRASQGDVAVIWGGALYAIACALAVLRWWRNPT